MRRSNSSQYQRRENSRRFCRFQCSVCHTAKAAIKIAYDHSTLFLPNRAAINSRQVSFGRAHHDGLTKTPWHLRCHLPKSHHHLAKLEHLNPTCNTRDLCGPPEMSTNDSLKRNKLLSFDDDAEIVGNRAYRKGFLLGRYRHYANLTCNHVLWARIQYP